MKIFLTIIALLAASWGHAQTINPNYIKAKQGDIVPFKEAVITNLPTYRLETRKIKMMETLIDSLSHETGALRHELAVSDTIAAKEKQRADGAENQLKIEQDYTDKLQAQLDKAFEIEKRQQRIWNRKELWLVIGVGIGIYMAK